LIPVDTSGRVLELIILLEDLWQAEPELARVYPLFLVGREVTRVLEVASNNVGAMKRRNREREVSSRCVAKRVALRVVRLPCHSASQAVLTVA